MDYEQLKNRVEFGDAECKKKRYYTPDKANKHANALLRKYGTNARVYRCSECGFYHVTTTRRIQ